MCGWVHRQPAAPRRVEANERKGPKVGRRRLPPPDLTPQGQEPARWTAQGDGAPLGGLLRLPGAAAR